MANVIGATISITDNMSSVMLTISRAVDGVANSFETLETASGSAASGAEQNLSGLATAAERASDVTLSIGDSFDSMQQSANGAVSQTSRSMESVVTAADRAKSSIAQFDESFNSLKSGAGAALSGIKSKAAEVLNGIRDKANETVKAFKNFGTALKSFPAQSLAAIKDKFVDIKNKITEVKAQATAAAGALKAFAQTKVSNAVTGLRNLKDVLTQGKTGATGFAEALKNIGKVSVVGAVNTFKNLGTTISNVAKNGADTFKNFGTAIANAAKNGINAFRGVESEIGNISDEIDDAENSQNEFNRSIERGTEHAGKLKAAFGTVAKVGATAVAGMTAAIAGLVGASVKGYADYEQLIGGVETLFGAGGRSVEEYAQSVGSSVSGIQSKYDELIAAQDAVVRDAQQAYMTAGLSANEYMETVTGFSASLIASLGGDTTKAATYANQALVDMSDNANKMGTDMMSIQNAYQGFAKQNYTMLDNLKLGYGGTQEEMKRLLQDAQKLTGQKYDISSFADITQAIHAIQTQMDITGTTAKEASTTISGSFNSMRAAFKNTIIGMTSDDAMFEEGLNGLVETAAAFAQNIIPAVLGALNGVGYFVGAIGDMVTQAMPTVISDILPKLISGAMDMLKNIASALSQNSELISSALKDLFITAVQGIKDIAPDLADMAATVAFTIADALWQALTGNSIDPSIFDNLKNAISGVVDFAERLLDGLGKFVGSDTGVVTLTSAFTFLGLAVAAVKIGNFVSSIKALSSVGTFAAGLKTLALNTQIATAAQWLFNTSLFGCPIIWIIAAIAALIAIIVLCVKHWDQIKAAAVACWEAIKSAWGSVKEWFASLWEGIKSVASTVWNGIVGVFTSAKDKVSAVWSGIKELFSNLWNGIKEAASTVWGGIVGVFTSAKDKVSAVWSGIKEWFAGLWSGIKDVASTVWNGIVGVVSSVWSAIWGVISPVVLAIKNLISAVFGAVFSIISAIVQGIWATVVRVFTAIKTTITTVCTAIWGGITTIFTAIWTTITTVCTTIWNTIVTIWNTIVSVITGVCQAIWSTITTIFTAIWTTITTVCTTIWTTIVTIWNTIVSVITGVCQAIWNKITSIWNSIVSTISSVCQSIWNKITSVWNNITSTISNVMSNIKNKISTAWSSVVTTISSKMQEIYNKIKSKFTEVVNYIGNLKDKLVQKGKDIIQGLIDGIASKINAVADKIKEVGETVTNGIKEFFNINSPSKVMRELGEFTFMGFNINNGLESMIDDIKRTSVKMGEVVTTVTPVADDTGLQLKKTPEDYRDMRERVSSKTTQTTIIKAPISVQIKNDNTFNSETDSTDFARRLANGIAQQVGFALEGVY